MSRYYRANGCKNCRCVTGWWYLCPDCWRIAAIMPVATIVIEVMIKHFFQ